MQLQRLIASNIKYLPPWVIPLSLFCIIPLVKWNETFIRVPCPYVTKTKQRLHNPYEESYLQIATLIHHLHYTTKK